MKLAKCCLCGNVIVPSELESNKGEGMSLVEFVRQSSAIIGINLKRGVKFKGTIIKVLDDGKRNIFFIVCSECQKGEIDKPSLIKSKSFFRKFNNGKYNFYGGK